MHLVEAFKYLVRQLLGFCSRNTSFAMEILVEIAMTAVFHGNEYGALSFIPSERFHEPPFILRYKSEGTPKRVFTDSIVGKFCNGLQLSVEI
jgi:hypothetical protein